MPARDDRSVKLFSAIGWREREGQSLLGGAILIVVGVPIVCAASWLRLRAGMPWHRAALWTGLAIYALAAASMLFFPVVIDLGVRATSHQMGLWHWVSLTPFKTTGDLLAHGSSAQAIRQIGGNIGLLLPPSLVAPVLAPRLRSASILALLALITTVTIESVQYAGTAVGVLRRSADIDDVILNVLGALVGWAAWRAITAAVSRRRGARRPERDGDVPVGSLPAVPAPSGWMRSISR
jgi:glycopeptide antibiotics resistance protein